ncbi:MAG: NAD(P)-dependent oxidoreductase [Arenimonas sp.]|nr:NAD(P)-dependent oxidoreductase [Arenimonas sp.]
MKVLVSGGTGLVGRYVVEALLSAGDDVTVGGRSAPQAGYFSRPVKFRSMSLDPDLDHIEVFDEAYMFVHAAFDHVAGKYRGGEGDDSVRFRRLNLDGTVRLFEAARRAGVRRVVFLSSRAVYDGIAPGAPLVETAALHPTSLYGEVKLLAEQVLKDMSGPGFAGSSLRLTGVYGHLRPNKWDGLFADYQAGRAMPVRAGSEVHGRDVGQAVRLMLESDTAKVGGEAFNVSDIVTDSHEILAALKLATRSLHPLPEPADKTVVAEMVTDKIRALGWKPGGLSLLESTVHCLADSV